MKKLITRFSGDNTEGIGSILQGILHLYAYCRINNYEFVGLELNNISHYQYLNETSEEYNQKLNNFFNLTTSNKEYDEFIDPSWLILDWGEKFNNVKHSYISELFNKLKYDGPNYFDNNKKTLSLHIRNLNSQDVCFDERREYLTEDKKKYYINLIENVIDGKIIDYDIHIFSQGNIDEFKIFEDEYNAKLHINDEIINTLYHLITSDVLITSNSSFSWISHLYGQNKKVYSRNNFFHSWSPNTILVDYNGNIIKQ